MHLREAMSAQNKISSFRHFYERIGSTESDASSDAGTGIEVDIEEQPVKPVSWSTRYKRYLIPSIVGSICCVALIFFVGGILTRSHDGETSDVSSWRLDTHKNYTIDSSVWRSEEGPQERHYFLNISKLVEVSPDGIIRNLTVINGQYPGPLLEANAGDTLNIHVTNSMQDEPTTIHCHGLLFNQNENFLDGASSINQCPLQPGQKYTYKIHLDENQWGTYWYHSHFAAQYADGVFGPLVIHSKKEDELLGEESRYDSELVILVNDYYHDNANRYLEDYLAPGNENDEPTPDSGLMQGANVFDYNSATYIVPNNNDGDEEKSDIYNPSESAFPIMKLDTSKRYRVRLVNAGFFVPFSFSIDEHKLSIIETDGSNVSPVELKSVGVSVGQRYSFILQRQTDAKDMFWTRAQFNGFCLANDNDNFNQQVKGIISYNKQTQIPENEVNSVSWEYNGGDARCRDMDQTLFHTTNEKVPKVPNGTNLPDRVVKLDVAFLIKGMQLARGYFNEMTWRPLPNNENTLARLALSDETSASLRQANEFESRTNDQYLLNFDKRGEIVDIVINNYDDGAHPFHLHGYKFWVIGASEKGYFRNSYYEDDEFGLMNFEDAVQRDTINVSGYGWAVVRIVIDNPGVWPFHCHIGWHMESGLLLQINALQNEYSTWNHFPKEWVDLCEI